MISTTLRKFTFAASTAVALTAGLHAAAVGTAGWTRVQPAGGRFSVMMPVAPEHSADPVDTAVGSVTMHSYQAFSADCLYQVAIVDYPIAPSDVRTTLDGVRNGLSSKGRLIGEEEIVIQGHPGRMVKVEREGRTMHIQCLMVKNRLYQVLFLMSKSDRTPASATAFFDSFRLTD